MAQDLQRQAVALLQTGELQVEKLISLPRWLRAQSDSLIETEQRDETGRFRMMKVLPTEMLPSEQQHQIIDRKVSSMEVALAATPDNDRVFAAKTTECVTKMMLVLAGREAGEYAATAKGEAFMMALNDVPFWAVEEAMRRWYRKECDTGAETFDYHWMPDPGSFRDIARRHECAVRFLMNKLRSVREAPALEVDDPEKCQAMIEHLKPLLKLRRL